MSQVQPRVLVVQCLIGDFPLANLYLNEFMPTVRSWANRMNYSYQLLDKKLFDFRCGAFELIAQRFSFFRLYEEFDYLIYVDADIAVTKAAGSIPYVDFGAVIDAEGSANEVKDFFSFSEPYFNAGVFIVSSKMAKALWGKATDLMDGHYDQITHLPMADQNLLNLWVEEIGLSYTALSNQWNTMPHQLDWANKANAFFVHYAGVKSIKSGIKSDYRFSYYYYRYLYKLKILLKRFF
jgi:lipopolysaccharide biosynthesis glycosyltransferase